MWWINHSSLWRMASATPDLRLSSQSFDYRPSRGASLPRESRLVQNCTAWWRKHICVNNLPKVVSLPESGTAGSWTVCRFQCGVVEVCAVPCVLWLHLQQQESEVIFVNVVTIVVDNGRPACESGTASSWSRAADDRLRSTSDDAAAACSSAATWRRVDNLQMTVIAADAACCAVA